MLDPDRSEREAPDHGDDHGIDHDEPDLLAPRHLRHVVLRLVDAL